jgi:hypothetical protein
MLCRVRNDCELERVACAKEIIGEATVLNFETFGR